MMSTMNPNNPDNVDNGDGRVYTPPATSASAPQLRREQQQKRPEMTAVLETAVRLNDEAVDNIRRGNWKGAMADFQCALGLLRAGIPDQPKLAADDIHNEHLLHHHHYSQLRSSSDRMHPGNHKRVHIQAIRVSAILRGIKSLQLPIQVMCHVTLAAIVFNLGLCNHLKVTVRRDRGHYELLESARTLYDMSLRLMVHELKLDVADLSLRDNLLQTLCVSVLDNLYQVNEMLAKRPSSFSSPPSANANVDGGNTFNTGMADTEVAETSATHDGQQRQQQRTAPKTTLEQACFRYWEIAPAA